MTNKKLFLLQYTFISTYIQVRVVKMRVHSEKGGSYDTSRAPPKSAPTFMTIDFDYYIRRHTPHHNQCGEIKQRSPNQSCTYLILLNNRICLSISHIQRRIWRWELLNCHCFTYAPVPSFSQTWFITTRRPLLCKCLHQVNNKWSNKL